MICKICPFVDIMEHITLSSEPIFNLGPIPITNSIIAVWMAIILLVILSLIVKTNLRSIPSGLQNIFEYIIEGALGLIDNVTQDREKTKKFFPWVFTFFIFILTVNWMELLPGLTSVGWEVVDHGEKTIVPFFRSANTDLNTTIALASISVIITQIFGVAAIGFGKYFKKFINFSGFINFFVGILELISEFAKVVSFSFRLFGNIFAGEVLLVVITFLIPYVVPVPFYGLEIFVGFIQALVFAMLSVVFMTMATIDMHPEEH